MEFKSDEDVISFYKIMEAEMNNIIHTHTNTRAFLTAYSRAMECHLKQMRVKRRITTRWLHQLNLATKDELASLANRIIECQEKVDSMDETSYLAAHILKGNREQLKTVRKLWDEWFTFLKREVREIRIYKRNTLKKDLLELKQLFELELDMEEKDNDRE